MMKKLLLLSSAIFAFNFGAVAQITSNSTVVVTDTLVYFLNKQKFKIHYDMDTSSPFFKAPTSAAANSHTYVTHCGSIFWNSDSMLMVNGLEAYVSKNVKNSSLTGAIPVHLYLFNVDHATGLPTGNAIDSIVTGVNNPCPNGHCPPQVVSGNFTTMVGGQVTANPRRVKGDFAVVLRNYSSIAGDTVRMFITSTLTHGSPVITGPGSEFYKTGENLGIMRKNGVWRKTTHMIDVPGFGGWGTDYEFLIAPRVTFTMQISQQSTDSTTHACLNDCMSFTNTSSPEITNRQFNMNEFYRELQPFVIQPVDGFLPDTTMSWDFDDDPRIDTLPHRWGRVQDIFLAPGANTMCKLFDTLGVFLNGRQTGHYRKMTGSYSTRVTCTDSFAVIVSDCSYYVGIKNQTPLTYVNVYPNPAINGNVNITGLQGKNTIVVFNILGQVVSSEITEKTTTAVDLAKQPAGSYTIRISSADGRSKSVKLINTKD